jgi:hypothetical protein
MAHAYEKEKRYEDSIHHLKQGKFNQTPTKQLFNQKNDAGDGCSYGMFARRHSLRHMPQADAMRLIRYLSWVCRAPVQH